MIFLYFAHATNTIATNNYHVLIWNLATPTPTGYVQSCIAKIGEQRWLYKMWHTRKGKLLFWRKVFLSMDSFSSALLVVSSKGEGGRGRTFWQVFCSIRFSAQARHLGFESGCMPWSKYLDPELSWGWILGMNFGDEVWGWTFVGRIWYFHPRSGTKVPLALFIITLQKLPIFLVDCGHSNVRKGQRDKGRLTSRFPMLIKSDFRLENAENLL